VKERNKQSKIHGTRSKNQKKDKKHNFGQNQIRAKLQNNNRNSTNQ
jgi:hypothetical protein